jgi:hypothetical protein
VGEFLWQLARNFWLNLAQRCTHFVFLLLLLLNLTECRDCALGNLVRVLNVVLQLLVAKIVRLLLRTKDLLLLCDNAAVNF